MSTDTTPTEHEPVSVHRHHEYSLVCSCGGWKGKSPVDLEGHTEHVKTVTKERQ